MAEVKLRALGLREVDFGDYDRYLTALGENGRKIEIRCRGARRGSWQVPAARQFGFSEFVLSERGGKYTLREAALIHSFFGLTQNIVRYALACYLAELASALSSPDEDRPVLCRLLLGALYALENPQREDTLVKAAFEWRIMAESGYAPDLFSCGVCGKSTGKLPAFFSVRMGTAAHEECVRRVGGNWVRLAGGTSRAIWHVLSSDPRRVYAFQLLNPAQGQFCALAEQYALYYLERGFGSLQFYKSLLAPL